ncbi:ThuA domain-containing protein [Runella sp.]|uniref:ThuA domain-containing protein n=1 Tax=Runella sp. TaxID=1960881 RepID=UPI003D0F4E83
MRQLITILLWCFVVTAEAIAQDVLIVADEIPAMQVLTQALKAQEGISTRVVFQNDLPNSLTGYRAVIVYIHKDIDSGSEKAFIQYAKNGGKLLVLHHSISSAKRKNAEWFPFLGIDLSKKDVSEGGYKYVGDITMEVVNLAPDHFITSNKITYDASIAYTREGQSEEKNLPGFVLPNTEAFLNHDLQKSRTILLGFKMKDATGKVWMQDRSAWCMPVEKGWVFYSQPGHSSTDFANPIYTRIIANAVIYKF